MECVLETTAATILHGWRGSAHVTLEEGTWVVWLYDMVKPHVANILVCDPRQNALFRAGYKNDRIGEPALILGPDRVCDRQLGNRRS